MIYPSADKKYYLKYNLVRDPFPQDVIDKILYLTPELNRRLELLKNHIKTGNKLLVVIAPPGGGKSVIAEHLASLKGPDWLLGLLSGTGHINNTTMCQALLNKIFPEREFEPAQVVNQVHKLLESSTLNGKIPVFIIDDAHLLPTECLQFMLQLVRAKFNEATFRIVLFANESINDLFAKPDLRELASGIVHELNLPPLTEAQTREYLENRLTLSGAINDNPFTDDAIDQIARISAGLPGSIGLLARQHMCNQSGVRNGFQNWPGRRFAAVGGVLVLAAGLAYYYSDGRPSLDAGSDITLPPAKPLVEAVPTSASGAVEGTTIDAIEQQLFEAQVSLDLSDAVTQPDTPITPPKPAPYDSREEARPATAATMVSESWDTNETHVPAGTEGLTEAYDETDKTAVELPVINRTGRRGGPDNIYNLDTVPEFVGGINGPDWFRQQSMDLFVLQILSASEFSNVERMLKKIPDSQGQLSGYTNYTPSGQPRYLLYYGLYPDRQTAYAAVKDIPQPLQAITPWPRDIRSIRNQLDDLESRGYY